MSDIDPSKLKVAELRAELQARGLDTKGNKPVLVERLREALEQANDEETEDAGDIELEPDHDVREEDDEDPDSGHENEPILELEPDREFEHEAEHDEPALELEPEGDLDAESEPEPEPEPEPKPEPQSEPSPRAKSTSPPREDEPSAKGLGSDSSPKKDAADGNDLESSRRKSSGDDDAVVVKEEAEEDEYYKRGYEDAPMQDISDVKQELGNGYDGDMKMESVFVKEESIEPKQETSDTEDRRGEKRRAHSRSRSPDSKKARPEVEEVRVEDEPEHDKSAVLLDWYNSDLSLLINKEDFLSAQPLTMQGFGYVWHGVRATYGFTRGRIFYEVKVLDYLSVPHLEEDEQHPHVVRVGWSIDEAGLTLGEDPFSYGYGGTGKASTNLKFKDYGKTFGKGDVVGCYLDLEAEPIVMSFTVNGENQGTAYEISRSTLGERVLFPHILTKNCSFKVNFGAEDPWFTPLTRYTYVGHISQQDRVLGGQGPATREEAEVIMMVGLPACGKTVWVEKYCKENPEKKYCVLGTNFLIDKMKVNGLPRKRNYSGRWDVLIERCTKCLNKLLEMSYKRRRNFIIDQTNVYPSAQRRKMKGFAGFYRRAVVICPSDENLKKRTEKREKEEGKDVPDKAVLEMKANFKLPEEGELFDAVEFVELQREEAGKLVAQYNKEGETAGFGQKKGFRGGFHDRRGGFMENRGGYGNRGSSNFRGGWDRDRRGGYTDRRDRGGWNRDRDNRDYNRSYGSRGGYNRDNRSGGRELQRVYSKDRSGRSGGYYNDWNRNSNYDNKTSSSSSSTSQWAGHQGVQSNQGYGGYSNYSNQGWGSNQQTGSYNTGGYGQSYSGNWNQQYYQQQYWNQSYGSYGSQQGYGSSQQSYGSQSSTSPSSSSWSQQGSGSWGNSGTGNTGWGSYGSSYQSGSRR
ncbi:heterogeneous nuclear ribonucleoprotein U-like protein 1 [Palaemon carinicauda]|uniref:heterogeneous nuclear ribonucleoprotein U-like protein 1 n=1 Tax=Palaemon carinicauda TaxID=392227 RepID=UPI0035B5AD30